MSSTRIGLKTIHSQRLWISNSESGPMSPIRGTFRRRLHERGVSLYRCVRSRFSPVCITGASVKPALRRARADVLSGSSRGAHRPANRVEISPDEHAVSDCGGRRSCWCSYQGARVQAPSQGAWRTRCPCRVTVRRVNGEKMARPEQRDSADRHALFDQFGRRRVKPVRTASQGLPMNLSHVGLARDGYEAVRRGDRCAGTGTRLSPSAATPSRPGVATANWPPTMSTASPVVSLAARFM
jgi:hypothetical protein